MADGWPHLSDSAGEAGGAAAGSALALRRSPCQVSPSSLQNNGLADEQSHQSQKEGCILFDSQQTSSVKLDVLSVDEKKWNELLKSFSTNLDELSQPKAFVDVNDKYPTSYNNINANSISESCLSNDIPIGIPREFATQFSTIGHGNIMIVGDDPDGEKSIITSVYSTLRRTNRLSNLTVFDTLEGHFAELSGLETHNDLDMLPLVENGILCLLHMDAINPINKAYSLIEKARKKHIQILLFARKDIFSDGLGLTSTAFTTKIALCNAPEGFISPVHFYVNDELRMPTASMHALIEQTNAEEGMGVKDMWLFNY